MVFQPVNPYIPSSSAAYAGAAVVTLDKIVKHKVTKIFDIFFIQYFSPF